MIRTVLCHIRDSINQHFKNEFNSDDILVLSNLIDSDGGLPANIANKMVFFLVGLSEEATLKNKLNLNVEIGDKPFPKTSHFNLQVLFCANFEGTTNYEDGLMYLASLIGFFQINKIMMVPGQADWTANNSNKSAENEIKVSFELCNLDYSELSHLWSAIGGKLKPSALYKVGIVSIDDTPISSTIPSFSDAGSKSK